MLLIKVDKGKIEKSLKDLKSKILRSKQNVIILRKKEFVKKSVQKRNQKKRAIYIQKLNSVDN